jgi:hypothetical protein
MNISHHITAQLAQDHQRRLARDARKVRVAETAEKVHPEALEATFLRAPEAQASGAARPAPRSPLGPARPGQTVAGCGA